MDFLDPSKVRRHTIMLFVGYALIGIAIVATALVLLYQSSGFGITKTGDVIQNGLIFTASNPSGAQIFINGEDSTSLTNKRLVLVAGEYVLQYKKDGYTTWTHATKVDGGTVTRLDYAFLFPKALSPVKVATYAEQPQLVSQSSDRRWLVVKPLAAVSSFTVYDLRNIQKAPVILELPAGIVTSGPNESWEAVEWDGDSKHLLLRHTVAGQPEFIVLDRENSAESVNLNKTLSFSPAEVKLKDKKFDKYYLYAAADQTLRTASLEAPTPVVYLDRVLAYKPYGDDKMLYVTDDETQASPATNDKKLSVVYVDGDQNYTIRKMPVGNKYLLEIAGYSDKLYMAAGVDTEGKTLVYRNPLDQIKNKNLGVAVPVATLRVQNANHISFSVNARYVMIENGNNFSVYDAEDNETHTYTIPDPIDAQAAHASWMDGNRLTYPSGGKLLVFDADKNNRRKLINVSPGYEPAFTPDYKQMLTVGPDTKNPSVLQLQRTWLRIQADR